jgi:hypothetical protein
MKRRAFFGSVAAVAAGAAVVGLVGCGERPQVIEYKQGKYQGKPDHEPWKGKQWNDSRQDWTVAVETRAQNQNEYKRIK